MQQISAVWSGASLSLSGARTQPAEIKIQR